MSEETPTTDDPTADRAAEDSRAGEGIAGLLDPRTLPLRYHVGIVGLVALALIPFGVPEITMLKITGALYLGMFAMSWDAVSGYTGEISFGHALFFTIGGYSSALLNLEMGVDPLLSIPIGMVLAAVAGVLIGVPALRLHGPYLSLITLIAPLILMQIFILYSDVFGGEIGLPRPDPLVTADEYLLVVVANYYVALALFVFILAVLLAVTRSNAGAVFTAIREDPDAVSASGINPAKFKIFAFVLSGAIGGLAGATFVHTPVGGPQPSQLLNLVVSIEVIIASILGGMGTIVGAAIGGMFFFLFSDYLDGIEATIPFTDLAVGDASFLVFAVVTLVILYFAPGGMLRWALFGGRKVRERLGGDEVAADGGETPLERTVEKYRTAVRSFGPGGDDDE
ncbi:branched-chain amino acid ABC transporter permease [Halostella sp. JP-L12]|uniref:branched-chain amino acid ABC transporter permease n=1 Tax=Halostella TaxID=1843185 RepID=UPI000EF846A4|nr:MULTISPECIES: branched-chain amino acid ABC transporter permease [Halostella]NHN47846.1 branched-chain amino acid ABC transporter permease [Halostella sp. JP-L12]